MIEKEKETFKGNLVIDTGPLIDYLSDVGVAEIVQNDIIDNKEVKNIIISPITLTEIYYIFCRQKGEDSAKKLTEKIKKAVNIELEFNVRDLAGKYKCERALSPADCYVLATAKINSAIAIFTKEQELLDELDKEKFDLRIIILE